MIQIKPKKLLKKKITPYYLLVFNYMIGDANGYTKEEVEINKDNPYIERFCKLLNKLKPAKGNWGVVLAIDRIEKIHEEKQIKDDDYDFLCRTLFSEDYPESDDGYMDEFYEGVRAETEYSFLVFQRVTLYYIDESGIKHETEFTK